ncbi:hypothetical protein V498_08398 [Pseudogymnoascus sp. VKM F-4517 (FW-2822)]|nr:hypothetical protein V498_08398 [Pseudogymnoascus sp. VKM F-4517 (FW-2822)]
MWISKSWAVSLCCLSSLISATILQNGQVRVTDYPNTVTDASSHNWKTYPANAAELSYKGRWDDDHISWWSVPGLKFGFTGKEVGITFGPQTSNGVLVAYRINGEDWQFSNITTNATHLLVSPSTEGVDLTTPISPSTFELRVTNWAYGVQVKSVHVAAGASLIKLKDYNRRIEVIGDSLSSGMYGTYEGLSSYAYGLAAGLGDTEYSVTAYPGICVTDQECWGNPRGQTYQWYRTSDTGGRATNIYGTNPPLWNFSKHPAADIVVINLGTNDNNTANNVTNEDYYKSYVELVEGVHNVWPNAQIIISVLPPSETFICALAYLSYNRPYGTASAKMATPTFKAPPSSLRSGTSTSTSTAPHTSRARTHARPATH